MGGDRLGLDAEAMRALGHTTGDLAREALAAAHLHPR